MVSSNRTRGNGHRWKHRKFCLNIRKHFFYCDGERALAQVACRCGRVSVRGKLKKLSGHDLGQPALGNLASPGGLDKMTSRGPFQR